MKASPVLRLIEIVNLTINETNQVTYLAVIVEQNAQYGVRIKKLSS